MKHFINGNIILINFQSFLQFKLFLLSNLYANTGVL